MARYDLIDYGRNPNYTESVDDFEMSYEEENEAIRRHVKTCKKAERDEYCKVCLDY